MKQIYNSKRDTEAFSRPNHVRIILRKQKNTQIIETELEQRPKKGPSADNYERSSVIEFVWSERDFVSGTAIERRKPVGEE